MYISGSDSGRSINVVVLVGSANADAAADYCVLC